MNEGTIWQVSAGSTDRSYADVFVNNGVALIGPGDSGPWRAERSDEDFEGGWVRRFADELRTGDVLLLRTGRKTIQAVGVVASDYQYLPQFDDVNGWDLQHARRVCWRPLPEPHDFGVPVFGMSPPRVSRVRHDDAVNYARRFVGSPPTDWQSGALPSLPVEEEALEEPPDKLRNLVAQVRDLADFYWDAREFGERPSEHELVGHYVLPFLRALGWPAEHVAVEWRNVDVAVFSRLPRAPEHCRFLIEAKRLGEGVEGALDQAIDYVSALGVTCDVVVTDGTRYRMYDASRDYAPAAYANLARLKRSALTLFDRMRRP